MSMFYFLGFKVFSSEFKYQYYSLTAFVTINHVISYLDH